MCGVHARYWDCNIVRTPINLVCCLAGPCMVARSVTQSGFGSWQALFKGSWTVMKVTLQLSGTMLGDQNLVCIVLSALIYSVSSRC